MQARHRTMVVVMAVCLAAASLAFLASNNEFGVLEAEAAGGSGTTLYVGGSGAGNYSSIQAAIDAASSGDTIFVYSGTYYENLVINKSVDLIGEKTRPVIDGQDAGNIIEIHYPARYVNFSWFRLENSGTEWPYYWGIKLNSVHLSTLSSCGISDTVGGIWLRGCSNITISHFNISTHMNYSIILEDSLCDILPAMNGGASYAAEGWRKVPNVV